MNGFQGQRLDRSGSTKRWRAAYGSAVTGVSVIALALAANSLPAASQSLNFISVGRDGTAAHGPIIGSGTEATVGENAESYDKTNGTPLGSSNTPGWVQLQSFGGTGGHGQRRNPGNTGGSGGSLKLTQTGDIFGYGMAPFSMGSYGGAGGNGDYAWGGSGGTGGSVELNFSGAIRPSANATTMQGRLINLESLGGAGGAAGGGAGGSASRVRLNFSGSLAPHVDARLTDPLISLRSIGGNGSNAASGFFSSNGYAGGTGGAGGQVEFLFTGKELSASLSGQTSGIPAIWLLSQGGTGGNGYDGAGTAAGSGGAGGAVTADIGANIRTSGDNYAALRATSQGGDVGEVGSFRTDASIPAGTGGSVSVNIRRNVTVATTGAKAPAIIAESRGGKGLVNENRVWKGGNGGNIVDTQTNPSVKFMNNGTVRTEGENSTAVVLQSVGGNGGNSGPNADGGAGGTAGRVAGSNLGTIETMKAYSFGLVAQSIGGSGGNGGWGFFIGGDGGSAGKGGEVKIVNEAQGSILTHGVGATAIIAQSVGGGNALDAFQGGAILPNGVKARDGIGTIDVADGGGGAGGDAWGLFFARGGDGGTGGTGGTVSVDNKGHIKTDGEAAYGILAQSIGGSGGAAGSATAVGGFLAVALGGSGGGGGSGGSVTIGSEAGSKSFTEAREAAVQRAVAELGLGATAERKQRARELALAAFHRNDASITTAGDDAPAIIAQSVGGGGGTGGSALAASVGAIASVSVSVGGSGGKGGHGGIVDVWNVSAITTQGSGSTGIQAHSIGGGGGSAGSARSYAIAVGSGPYPAVPISVAVGGSGGDGGDGGAVKLRSYNRVATKEASAPALEAISIGGGGGTGGNAFSYALGIQTGSSPAIDINVSVGGSGGDGGKGGGVTVMNHDVIDTAGTASYGINAMSVGGGGGKAGDARSVAGLASFYLNINVPVTIGGSGGGGGRGEAVTVDNAGSIRTGGQFATAVNVSSIGGGGGQGGTADSTAETGIAYEGYMSETVSTLSSAMSFGKSITANVTIGGSGGKGGHGGAVTATNSGSILTEGTNSTAIAAYSIGGGGGSGGGFQGGGKGKLAANVRIGGSGGDGGNGGTVDVFNNKNAAIETRQDGSHGIFAQSIGGGGGNGGTFTGKRKSAPITAIGTEDQNWLAIGTKLVGEISKLNDAGKQVFGSRIEKGADETDESFKTRQDAENAMRFFRDKGFDKGSSLQKTIEHADKIASIVKGASALVDAYSKIQALEENKSGKSTSEIADIDEQILDIKIKAGFQVLDTAVSTALVYRFKDGLKKSFDTFATDAKNAKSANMKDWEKYYPSVSLNVGVGGSGGKGGDGGAVTIINDGSIATQRGTSYGIFAQSVGGGGGAGGGGFATGENQVNANISVGRNGAGGGNGNSVTVTNTGTIITRGATSFGLLAQSVGGGGGLGGVSSAENGISISANAMVGGDGGASGHGGKVTVTNGGTIQTFGKDAHALVAQSVGGGGGIFFNNLKSPREQELERQKEEADRKAALANLTPAEKEQVKKAEETVALIKKFVDFIGSGGGGDAGLDRWATILPTPSLNLSIGGNGAGGGNGNAVTVTHNGTITTAGEGAFGIFAQSIGGGGGFGANASSAGLSLDATIGGRGGVAGNGGTVDIKLGNAAKVSTSGDGAHAVFLQSIGGGGGYGGTSKTYLLGDIVRDGAARGDGGDITVKMSATDRSASQLLIATAGARAHGILAQSLGGGGGFVASLVGPESLSDSKRAGRAGAEGQGGKITIDTAGTISAKGQDSYGIFAQSGVQTATGSISKPSTRSSGFLGLGSRDVFLGGDISISHAGTITGGSGEGAAIRIDGGKQNTINIAANSVVSAESGTAIKATWGSELVNNSGTIIGNVALGSSSPGDDLGNEVNQFINHASGIYRTRPTGSTVTLRADGRADGLFTNLGAIDIGGVGTIGTGNIVGHLFNAGGGKLLVDVSGGTLVDFGNDQVGVRGPTSDRLTVSGQVSFDTNSVVALNPVIRLLPGSYTFLTTKGPIVGTPNIEMTQMAVPVTWNLGTKPNQASSGTDMWAKPRASFANPTGATLTSDQAQIAAKLQRGWDAEALSLAPQFQRYLGIASGPAYAAALDEGNSESIGYTAATNIASARLSLKASLSCPAFEGAGTLVQEGECSWGRIGGSLTRMGATSDEGGFRQESLSYRVGGQKEFMPGWFVGGSLGYAQSETKDADGITGFKSDGYDGSIAIKHQAGPWLFALSGSIGNTFQDNIRSLSIGDYYDHALSKARVLTYAARLRGAYEFAFDKWYVRPYLDLDAMHVRTPFMAESGAEGFNLNIYGTRKTVFSVSPNVEIGGRFDLANGYWLRPYGSVGVTLLSHDNFVTRASFQGVPAEFGTFTTTSRVPDQLLDLGLGLQMSSGSGFEFTAEYQSQLGKDYISQGGTARVSWRF